MLRVDIVKDDSGAYAVFAEQGSSASQMTAAKMKDVVVRLPDCAGQAADAVSAYAQVKMENAPGLLKKILNRNVQVYGYVFRDMNGPNLGQTLKIQWFFLNEICTDTHMLAACGRDGSRKFYWTWMGKSPELGMFLRSSKTRIILVSTRG